MAFTNDTSSGMVMPVSPMYGGGYGGGFGGFGGDNAWWVIILLLCGWGNGGFGGGFGGCGGNMMLGYDFPWLLNGQNGINNNVNDGFRTAQLSDSVTSVRDGVSNLATQLCGCCGDMQMTMANGFAGVQQSLCNGFAGTTAAVTGAQNALSQQLNTNEMASLNRSFAEQTANMQGFNGVQAGIADLRYTEATENCATRTASAQNTRDNIDAQNRGTQAILAAVTPAGTPWDGIAGTIAIPRTTAIPATTTVEAVTSWPVSCAGCWATRLTRRAGTLS